MKTAEHRPAVRPRKYRHDMYTFVDLFCGFGGLTQALVLAGFTPLGASIHYPTGVLKITDSRF